MLLRMSLISLLTYRINFLSDVFVSLLWSSVTILSIVLLTSHSSSVFGWSRQELWLLTGIYNVTFGIFYGIFSINFNELVRLVNKGELDSWLLKPVDSQFSVSVWQIKYASIIRFVIGVCYVLYLLTLLQIKINLINIFGFFILMIFSILLIYAVSFSILTLTIWFTTLSNLVELLSDVNNTTKYPQEMYRGSRLFLFFIIFPLTLVITIPTKFLLNKYTFIDIASLVFVSMLVFFLSRKFWQFALRYYTSASG